MGGRRDQYRDEVVKVVLFNTALYVHVVSFVTSIVVRIFDGVVWQLNLGSHLEWRRLSSALA